MTEPNVRNIWGNAFTLLANATNIIIAGFSFQPSDFYATWLFRHALKGRNNTRIWIVNPLNDPSHAEHEDFAVRMGGIFAHGYEATFKRFDQINEVIERVEHDNPSS